MHSFHHHSCRAYYIHYPPPYMLIFISTSHTYPLSDFLIFLSFFQSFLTTVDYLIICTCTLYVVMQKYRLYSSSNHELHTVIRREEFYPKLGE
ncbi:hypothetical protein BDZ97DRAFT_1024330 [Flammula alnicola]|nr:hypothetical protein BDZ97DRAFT_1024330 [Flammula alnicola]